MLVLAVGGCVPFAGQWDVASLAESHPELLENPGQRLGDATPYFIPRGNSAVLFLCHFPLQSTLSVSLPSEASALEMTAIRLALEGWENAKLGIRFAETFDEDALIKIKFAAPPSSPGSAGVRFPGTGYAVSECGLDSDWERAAPSDGRIGARLLRATVYLRTSKTDTVGREIPLTADELVGATLHELGHALGFSGHVATPNSVMAKATSSVRRFGRLLRRGGGFAAPSLAALYRVPSGTIVGSVALSNASVALFDDAMQLAARRSWQGPIVQVGDSVASLSWHQSNSRKGSLVIRGFPEALRSGQPLAFAASSLEHLLTEAQSVKEAP